MIRLYRALLRLYPSTSRREFGAEMVEIFGQRIARARLFGRLAILVGAVVEIAGNAAGAYTPSEASDPTARAADLATAGGGNANNDGRYVSGYQSGSKETPGFGISALEQLAELAKTPRAQRKPFAMFVSLVNPHDITFFPDAWQDAGYSLSDATSTVVSLPPNMPDSLQKKPSVQKAYRDALNSKSPFEGAGNTPQNYVNFYAHLHSVVEPQI